MIRQTQLRTGRVRPASDGRVSSVVERFGGILFPDGGTGFHRAVRAGMRKCIVAALLACVACQRYVPIELAPKVVGKDVRLSLNESGAAASFARIGSRIQQAEGRLLAANDSTLAIGVSAVTRTNGVEDAWNGDTVVFQRSQVVDVEQRKISRSRTLLSLGIVAVAGILAHQSLNHGDRVIVGGPPPHGGN